MSNLLIGTTLPITVVAGDHPIQTTSAAVATSAATPADTPAATSAAVDANEQASQSLSTPTATNAAVVQPTPTPTPTGEDNKLSEAYGESVRCLYICGEIHSVTA